MRIQDHIWCWRCVLWRDIDAPEACSVLFALASEHLFTIFVVNEKLAFIKMRSAVGVAQFSEADEVVLEAWYDVPGASQSGGDAWDG